MTTSNAPRIRDISGYEIFCRGGRGAAHAMAHELLDAGQMREGRARLGAFLAYEPCEGSQMLHLQWHQLVFELGTHDVPTALRRFKRYLLPAAVRSSDVLTDAPSAMWRIQLSSYCTLALPWEVTRARALENVRHDDDYVELHNLLALAGARDVRSLDRWLATTSPEPLLEDLAYGLRALAADDLRSAAPILGRAAPYVSQLGGSRGQNALFTQIADHASQRALLAA